MTVHNRKLVIKLSCDLFCKGMGKPRTIVSGPEILHQREATMRSAKKLKSAGCCPLTPDRTGNDNHSALISGEIVNALPSGTVASWDARRFSLARDPGLTLSAAITGGMAGRNFPDVCCTARFILAAVCPNGAGRASSDAGPAAAAVIHQKQLPGARIGCFQS